MGPKHNACSLLKPQDQHFAGHVIKKSSSQFVSDFSRPFELSRNSLALIFHGYTHKSEICTLLYFFSLKERARNSLKFPLSNPWVHTLKERQDSIPHEISAFYRLPRSPKIWQLTEKTVTTDSIAEKLDLFFFYGNGRKWTYFNFSRFSIMAAMTMWLLLKERCLHHTHSLPFSFCPKSMRLPTSAIAWLIISGGDF